VHLHTPVGPRLARRPLDRIVAVGDLLLVRGEHAARAISAGDILCHDGVAPFRQLVVLGQVADADQGAVVGRAAEDHRDGPVHVRPKHVGPELHAVAHRDAHIPIEQQPHRSVLPRHNHR
jgi:hypothetical protein